MRWQYWRGRALESLGRTAEARAIYQRLAAQRDYHGFLAADRLGSAYTITDTPLQVTPQTLDALLNQTPVYNVPASYTFSGAKQRRKRNGAALRKRWIKQCYAKRRCWHSIGDGAIKP